MEQPYLRHSLPAVHKLRSQGKTVYFYWGTPEISTPYDGPIPSMRLKAMRRGLQDSEYATMVEESGRMSHQEIVKLAGELRLADDRRDAQNDVLPGWKRVLVESVDYHCLRHILFRHLSGPVSGCCEQ